MNVKQLSEIFLIELSGLYSEQEIKSITFYAFHHILNFSRSDMLLKKEEQINDENLSFLQDILNKLKQEIPIQYVLGCAEFYGINLAVNPDVLIPRPETEELVDWIIKENNNKTVKILDIGTGSACIAIAIKKNILLSTVFASDISDKALIVAKENAKNNNAEIHFLNFDILNVPENIKFPDFDIIVSNPPYVTESEKKYMKNNVLKYEPYNALFVSDNDPLLFYKAVADFSLKLIKKKITLFFEINERFSSCLFDMLSEKGFSDIEVEKDINGKYRMLKCDYII
ncbi:MAG: peptide chain release factor N(5)-glutamine methyltransferase [Bacteroidetes bacterium]|nr:peptide chain release factor N(5)-glutamine methyltransferase [Bacteroidota bacterium]